MRKFLSIALFLFCSINISARDIYVISSPDGSNRVEFKIHRDAEVHTSYSTVQTTIISSNADLMQETHNVPEKLDFTATRSRSNEKTPHKLTFAFIETSGLKQEEIPFDITLQTYKPKRKTLHLDKNIFIEHTEQNFQTSEPILASDGSVLLSGPYNVFTFLSKIGIELEMRAYNSGFAYRYIVSNQKGDYKLTYEVSAFPATEDFQMARTYSGVMTLPWHYVVTNADKNKERNLVWSEEFNVDGKVNKDLWSFEHGYVRNKEYQWYQEENAEIKDGILTIEARYDSLAEHKITASSINTRGHYEFLYGQLEVRAKIPTVMGSWPAIWTLGRKYEWPSCGEIDVMEYYQINGVPHILANAAWGNDEKWQAIWNSKRIPFSHFLEKDPSWADKFHIWLMDWTENYIRIYLDGELLNDIDITNTINGTRGGKENPFHTPQYILLNLAIGGTNGGEPLLEKFPLKYEIDYVRVYK